MTFNWPPFYFSILLSWLFSRTSTRNSRNRIIGIGTPATPSRINSNDVNKNADLTSQMGSKYSNSSLRRRSHFDLFSKIEILLNEFLDSERRNSERCLLISYWYHLSSHFLPKEPWQCSNVETTRRLPSSESPGRGLTALLWWFRLPATTWPVHSTVATTLSRRQARNESVRHSTLTVVKPATFSTMRPRTIFIFNLHSLLASVSLLLSIVYSLYNSLF